MSLYRFSDVLKKSEDLKFVFILLVLLQGYTIIIIMAAK